MRSRQALLNRRAQRRIPRSRPRFGGAGVSPVGSVTFPTTPLVIRVLIALGADLSASPLSWAWEDITRFVRFDLGIETVKGRSENSTVTTDQCRMKLDNRDGRFNRRNPTGPYYGLLSMNTPIWVTVDAGSGVKTRVEMFVNSWPTRWSDQSTNDCTVTIECAGILRRLGQGSVLKSALRRATLQTSPAAYWPMEDESSAAAIASAISSVGTMLISTTGVTLASDSAMAGSDSLPAFTSGEVGTLLAGSVPTLTSTGFWAISTWARFPTDVVTDTFMRIADISVTGSTEDYWEISAYGTTSGVPAFQASSSEGSGIFLDGATGFPTPAPYDGDWHNVQVWATQNGSNIDAALYVDGNLEATSSTAGTIGQPVVIDHRPRSTGTAAAVECAIGHTSVHTTSTGLTDLYDAGIGHVGEMAHERGARLCAEEGVPFVSLASTSVSLGPQGIGTLLSILRECETVDMGVLYETGWGLGYQATSERYNATVAFTLDFALNHLTETPEPADDDLVVRNRWTVSRPDGSEYTTEQDVGPMRTGAGGPGVYDDQLSANVETDTQLRHQAGWRVHLGTVDEDRWPRLDFNLARNPELIDTWTALPYGARMNLLNPLTGLAPDTIDAFIEGHREQFTSKTWIAGLMTAPASPYEVQVVADTTGNRGRVDAANSTLAADATDVATTISVASPSALWRTGTVSFDINVAGERMTVTDISGGSSPQTFTVTRSVNGVVKEQLATVGGRSVKVSLWKPAVYAL